MSKSDIGFIGLGRMGKNMVLNLVDKNYKVSAYNRSPKTLKKTRVFRDMKEMVKSLKSPKIIWIMVTAGKPVDSVLTELTPLLSKGDIIIDGGNSFYKDSIKRANKLSKKSIHFLDCGTSGGIEGARNGSCMMIGGNKKAFSKAERFFESMCVKNGYGYMGKSGAGHFVKMVHNGIEYGMMGAIAEGFQTISKNKEFKIDAKEVAKVYAHGSIVSGYLMNCLLNARAKKDYSKISCEVPRGETEEEMKFLIKNNKMNILKDAVRQREDSRKGKFCGRDIAAMRNEFGGHKVKRK